MKLLIGVLLMLLTGCSTTAALVSDSKGAWILIDTVWEHGLMWCEAGTAAPKCTRPVIGNAVKSMPIP